MAEAALARHSGPDRLSRRNFERLSRFVYDYSGIKMPPSKLTMLEGRLRRRLRATGLGSFDAYCAFLFERDGLAGEAVHLIDVVTTNKTDFFREGRHFEYLANHALPALARDARGQIKAWSAACSTGAEPYSLAMVLEEVLGAGRDLDYSIVATDLCTEVLDVARRGVFPLEALSPIPASLRTKYVLEPRDAARREGRIAPALRARVAFGRLNLMDDSYGVDQGLDIVFCRNVLIYFDKPTQAKVLTRICQHLRPGGHLFLGHSESITGIELPLRTVANTVFVRTDAR